MNLSSYVNNLNSSKYKDVYFNINSKIAFVSQFHNKPKTKGKLPSNDFWYDRSSNKQPHGPIRYHNCSKYELTMTVCTIYEIKLAINMLPQLCCKVMTLVKKNTFSSTRRSRGQADRHFLTGKEIFDRNIESTFSSVGMIGNIYVKP